MAIGVRLYIGDVTKLMRGSIGYFVHLDILSIKVSVELDVGEIHAKRSIAPG